MNCERCGSMERTHSWCDLCVGTELVTADSCARAAERQLAIDERNRADICNAAAEAAIHRANEAEARERTAKMALETERTVANEWLTEAHDQRKRAERFKAALREIRARCLTIAHQQANNRRPWGTQK